MLDQYENYINVIFVLRGHLMWYPENKKKFHTMQVKENSKIIHVINELKVPFEQINIVIKNGYKVDINSTMANGDTIEIVPIIAGG